MFQFGIIDLQHERHTDCPAYRPYVFGYTVGWLMTRGATILMYCIVAHYLRPQGAYAFFTKVPILTLSKHSLSCRMSPDNLLFTICRCHCYFAEFPLATFKRGQKPLPLLYIISSIACGVSWVRNLVCVYIRMYLGMYTYLMCCVRHAMCV